MVQRKKEETKRKSTAAARKGRKIKSRSLKKVRGGLLGSAGAVERRQKKEI